MSRLVEEGLEGKHAEALLRAAIKFRQADTPVEQELVDALVRCGFEESHARTALQKLDRIRDFDITYPVW